ncbi:uncharacterized protein A4U43_C06F15950 [Asparagus officinalis]|uniref:Uncharacterized protein n=1 Tax=Asparagus officinalis TaxID=4686 RepID=A0A5P1EN91_ASPOF|nr:uncharacterized protein A4U43_C06F15950 [Asparagus officinalis]
MSLDEQMLLHNSRAEILNVNGEDILKRNKNTKIRIKKLRGKVLIGVKKIQKLCYSGLMASRMTISWKKMTLTKRGCQVIWFLISAGIGIWSSGFAPPVMMSRAEALIEELRRERMREEILVREIANNRMMKEEIMKELEFERQMAMRRFGEEERLLLFEMESRVGIGMGERLGPGFMSERERSLSRGRAWIYDGEGCVLNFEFWAGRDRGV